MPDEPPRKVTARSLQAIRVPRSDADWFTEDTGSTHKTEAHMAVAPAVGDGGAKRASLTLLSGLHAGQVFSLAGAETVIGRSKDAHVRIDETSLSRAHSRILALADGRHVLEDMGSTNGTFLGGERILRAELTSGDRFQVGPNVVLRFAMVDEAEEALARQLYESSTRDALTAAYNRKYFFERLHAEVAFALRHGTRLGVILFDLDHFKTVNDTHGHIAGDQLLRRVATRVTELIRTEDVLARYGGEEFVLLARGIERPGLVLFAERVRRAVEELRVPWEDVVLRGTISVGLADVDECKPEGARAVDPEAEEAEVGPGEAMLVLADERLYRAKAAGRNRVCAEGAGNP